MRMVRIAALATLVAGGVACHHASPAAVVATPTRSNADSLDQARRARELALARARQDSIERAAAARRRADSLAALASQAEGKRVLETLVHFDFDRSDIRPEDARLLDQKVPILRAHPTLRIRITGNADERGSDEYNLVLGSLRATAAKRYLMSQGIDSTRIETLSNGEEHPIDLGHDESAWAANRNDQFTALTASFASNPR